MPVPATLTSYLPTLLVKVSPTTAVPDDSSFSTLPQGQVDYLSHDWREEDVWRSWRSMTRQKNAIANDDQPRDSELVSQPSLFSNPNSAKRWLALLRLDWFRRWRLLLYVCAVNMVKCHSDPIISLVSSTPSQKIAALESHSQGLGLMLAMLLNDGRRFPHSRVSFASQTTLGEYMTSDLHPHTGWDMIFSLAYRPECWDVVAECQDASLGIPLARVELTTLVMVGLSKYDAVHAHPIPFSPAFFSSQITPLKDSDVTWLYGPLHVGTDWTDYRQPKKTLHKKTSMDHLPSLASPSAVKPSAPTTKPILKRRSISQLLSLPASPFFDQDGSEENDSEDEDHDGVLERPKLLHTKSDTHISWRSRPHRKDSPPRIIASEVGKSGDDGLESATGTSTTIATEESSRSSTDSSQSDELVVPKKKHISFNTFVEQCIAIEKPKPKRKSFVGARTSFFHDAMYDDGYDEDSEMGCEGDERCELCCESVRRKRKTLSFILAMFRIAAFAFIRKRQNAR
ncbi:hypothetical protein QCA50_010421 [Cerrena zonata]|uniref:Uncharacterized protein n=1 Tax=Cerrena zonata TaxID=2478898 RepID=A0AAW0FZL2_9APHY